MSIGSLGLLGSLATTSLAQKAAEVEKTARDTTDAAREAAALRGAESAAGIGQTEEDAETSERDADGRRLWEAPLAKQAAEAATGQQDAHLSKDPTGEAGGALDLVG